MSERCIIVAKAHGHWNRRQLIGTSVLKSSTLQLGNGYALALRSHLAAVCLRHTGPG